MARVGMTTESEDMLQYMLGWLVQHSVDRRRSLPQLF
jgi:hypothetical protein